MATQSLCDKNCNTCVIFKEDNMRMVTKILNHLRDEFGEEVTQIVNSYCPNLTCCYDCHIDDFCHMEGCKIVYDNDEDEK